MNTPGGLYMLRDFNSALNAPSPTDYGILFRYVSLDANGEAVVDLSDVLEPGGAPLHYWMFNNTGVFPKVTATTFGTSAITISAGKVGISKDAESAPTGGVANVIPAASVSVLVGFIVQYSDLKKM